MVELQDRLPIFIGFKLSTSLRRQLDSITGPDRKYVSTDDSNFLRICSLGNDRYVGKLVDERLTTDRVEDIRRNIQSIMQRICPDVRLPHQMEILAGSLETGELISADQGGKW